MKPKHVTYLGLVVITAFGFAALAAIGPSSGTRFLLKSHGETIAELRVMSATRIGVKGKVGATAESWQMTGGAAGRENL